MKQIAGPQVLQKKREIGSEYPDKVMVAVHLHWRWTGGSALEAVYFETMLIDNS